MNHLKTSLIVLVLAVSVANLGCSSKSSVHSIMGEKNKQNIQKIANTYSLFFAMNPKRKGPASKEELVNFIKNDEGITRHLDFMGIDRSAYDSYFTSENDGEEFIIRWDQKVSSEGAGVPIVFESTGVDGVRSVGLSNGEVLEIEDEKKYQDLLAGKISKSEAGKEQRLMQTE